MKKKRKRWYSHKQYSLLKRCSDNRDISEWNNWRQKHPKMPVYLEGAWLNRAVLKNANLTNAHLKNAFLVNANLSNANLEKADIEGAVLNEANLEGVKLTEARMMSAVLKNAKLTGANLNFADLRGATIQGADLEGASMKTADLKGANLDRAHLKRVMLTNAHLEEASCVRIILDRANLNGAHLEKAILNDASLKQAQLRRAMLKQTKLDRATLTNTIMVEANLEQASLAHANIQSSNLYGATLEKTDLNHANLKESILNGANMNGAVFNDAILENAQIHNSSLNNAKLFSTNLKGASFRDVHLENAAFNLSIVDGSTLFWGCEVSRNTDFRGVGLGNLRIETPIAHALEYNIRRLSWKDWYRGKSNNKLNRNCPFWRFIYTLPIRSFWSISDYGRSAMRVLILFLIATFTFATVYYIWGYIDYYRLGIKDCPGIVTNLFVLEDKVNTLEHNSTPDKQMSNYENINPETVPWILVPFRSLYFSVVTMTTLGFGDICARPNCPIRGLFGHILLSIQVVFGYGLLGGVLTILTTENVPAAKFGEKKTITEKLVAYKNCLVIWLVKLCSKAKRIVASILRFVWRK